MPNTYTIPFRNRVVFYRPRQQLAFVGNRALAAYIERRKTHPSEELDSEIESFLESVGFDREGMTCGQVERGVMDPRPTTAVLMMTNGCNLRCVYCYADAGVQPKPTLMDWPTAKTAIDFVLANAAHDPDGPPPALTFHGGGEPSMHWELMLRAVEYTKAQRPDTSLSMSSNGIWSDNQRQFIAKHFTSISLSMDGLADVQNRQRPRPDGSESFSAVLDSIRMLEQSGVDYGIRMTVLEDSVAEMADGVRFLCEQTRVPAIQIEPTFTSARGHYDDIGPRFAKSFADAFMEAWRIGEAADRTVYYSGARPWVVSTMFCLAPLKALVVRPDHNLVTCFEAVGESRARSAIFSVGAIRNGRVHYDRSALQAFLDAQQVHRRECMDCFCYWHCCGDCAMRRIGAPRNDNGRCMVNRRISLSLLLSYIEQGDGVWQGLALSSAEAIPREDMFADVMCRRTHEGQKGGCTSAGESGALTGTSGRDVSAEIVSDWGRIS